jgi:hypothetical protein
MSREIKSEVVDAIMDLAIKYEEDTGKKPTYVWLTLELESKIESLTYNDIGSLSGEIFQKGARAALPKIFGLEIKGWNSDKVKVE